MTNSTTPAAKRKPSKPEKPRADFPLFPHAAGYWAKKIDGRTIYFGKWSDDPKGQRALGLWDDYRAGRTPKTAALTIKEMCNRFLTSKLNRLKTGELSSRSFHDYKGVTDRLIRVFGKGQIVAELDSTDFEGLRFDISKTRGPVALGNEIGRVRAVFNHTYEAGHVEKPVRFGPEFRKPSRKVLRQARKRNGSKMFKPAEIRALLDQANSQTRAMILLSVNTGYGNSDIGNLPISAVDFMNKWIDYPRPKTAVDRRNPLWSETVKALTAVLESRPTPLDNEAKDKLFVTKYGRSWVKAGDDKNPRTSNPISAEFRKLCQACGIYKKGRGFYSLRHVFQTIGAQTLDKDAVRFLMGHAEDANDMSAVYNEEAPSDTRLLAVTNHVHSWLWPNATSDDGGEVSQ